MISWTDDLNTGIAAIDDDHKFLVMLINTFSQMAKNGASSDHLGAAIEALGEYAENHFTREEALMMIGNYQQIKPHRNCHREFSCVVDTLNKLYRQCPSMVSIAGVSVFLQEWLLSHIAITDHAYVDQMNKHKGVIDLVSDNMRNDGSFSL